MNRSERRSVLHATQRVIGVASITSLRRSGRQILRRSQNIAVGADASFSRPGNGGVIVRLHLCLRLRTAFTRECLACKTIARIEKIQNQPSCFYFTPLLTKFFFFFSDDVFFLLHHHELHLCGFCVYYHCAVRLRYAAWCLHAEKVFHLGADETGRGVSGDLCSKQIWQNICPPARAYAHTHTRHHATTPLTSPFSSSSFFFIY